MNYAEGSQITGIMVEDVVSLKDIDAVKDSKTSHSSETVPI